MTTEIIDLHSEGINVLPLKVANGRFIHPDQYADNLTRGITTDEINDLVAKGYNGGMAIIHGPCNPDIMCLDFDEKNAPGRNLFDTWRHLIDDDIFRKLVIERTRSNGYHVYFRCDTLPSVKALASSPTGEEWIAIRSAASHGITYCAPSPGYKEVQGSLHDMQTLPAEALFAICSAAAELDQYTGFRTARSTALPAPRVPAQIAAIVAEFDKNIPDHFIPDYLAGLGWTTDGVVKQKMVNGEKWQYLRLWRPGRDTREPYSANYWLNRKRLSVFSSSTPFPSFDSGSAFSHPPSAVLYHANNRDWAVTLNAIMAIAKDHQVELPEQLPMVYWSVMGKREVPQVEVKGIIEWAVRSGFQWMRLSTEENSAIQLVRVVDNIIYDIDEKEITRAYIEEVEKAYPDADANRLLVRFMPQVMKFMDALPLFDQHIITDTVDTSYLYFNNGCLKITASEAKLIKYQELNGCVFSRYIIPFDYTPAASFGAFGKFIDLISIDSEHTRFMMSVLGYVMHHYKLRNLAKAVMIIEDVEDQDEARGRSGKGLIAQFIEWIRWTVQEDGRNFNSDSRFKMQRITAGVQVYYLNDPAPSLLMNQFYNYITDDWRVEAKGQKSYTIPFKDSPKILITTNYLPPLESDSDKDRFIVMPIKKHFGAHRSIRDEFPGVIFFGQDWPVYDRNGAISFAVTCLQTYLQHSIIDYRNDQFEQNASRRLIKTLVPDAVIEVVEQGLEAAKNAKNPLEFEQGIRVHDLRKDQAESIQNVFTWEPDGLNIHVSAMYQYCLKAYNVKMLDKVFGRKLRQYLKLSGMELVAETRNNTTGRRMKIATKSSAIKFSEAEKSAINGKNGGVDGTVFTPMEDFDPF